MIKRSISGFMLGIFLVLPMAANSAVFSIVVITDSQFYAERHPEILEAQIDWIVANQATENIIYVAQTGDLKDDQFCDDKTVAVGTGAGRTEWQIVDQAFSDLDTAGMAYAVAPGNHDFNPVSGFCPNWTTQRPLSEYNTFFGPARFAGDPFYGDPLALTPGNRVTGSNEDNFTLFDSNGVKFIAINLAFKPAPDALGLGSAELAWADNLLKTYPDRLGIVTSHYFLNTNDGMSPLIGPYGQEVYDTLSNNRNLFMMLSGHWYGEGWSSETTGRAGFPPTQILMANYQGYVFPDDGDPGTPANTPNPALIDFSNLPAFRAGNGATDAGFMRIMRFDTVTGQVDIETFIPPVVPIKNRTGTLVSTYFPASAAGMGEFTASNLSFSFTGYTVSNVAFLYVAHLFDPTFSDGSIERINIDGSNRTVLATPGGGLRGLVVDVSGNQMIYSDVDADTIVSQDLGPAGTVSTIIDTGLIFPQDLEISPTQSRLFWVEASNNELEVSDLDGGNRSIILTPLSTAIAVDDVNQKVYSEDRDTAARGSIIRSNFDGSALEVVATDVPTATSMAIDSTNQVIYWTSSAGLVNADGGVYRINFDGTGFAEIFVMDQLLNTSTGGLALDVENGHVYFGQQTATVNRYDIMRIDLDGSNPVTISTGYGNISELVLVR